jgi:hypothetical protein
VNQRVALGAAALAAVLAVPAFAGDLVTNGSFEDNFGAGQFNQTLPGSAGGQNASAPGTTASGWTVTGINASYPAGYAFIFSNTNSFTTTDASVGPASQYGNPGGPATLPLWGGSADASPEGNAFYGVDSTYHPSSLGQTIGGLTVGDQYTLSFEYAAAQQYLYNGNTTDTWVVTLGGQTIVTTPTIDLPSNGFSGWMTETVTFTYDGVGPDPNLLSFVDYGMGGCNSNFMGCAINDPGASGAPPFSLLDSVSLTAAPEPSTWAMMLIGFAGLSYAGLRSRRRPAISIVG